MPETAVKIEIESGLLKPINVIGFDLSVDFCFFYYKGKIFSKAASEFLKMLFDARLLTNSENLKDILT